METVTNFPIELNGFEPIRKLGSGGFGQVWLANQPALDRMVAIKVGHKPLESQDEILRFERECKALGRLSSSDHIIDIYFTGITDEGVPYLVLEYIDGGSLADQKNLSEERLRQIMVQLCEAIKNAHHSAVLHRDLKPANVFLRKNGTVVVGDFGVARLGDVEETSSSNQIVASLAYAAPEILHGQPPSEQSDVYGIAITILTAALGHSPFKACNSNATIYAVLHHQPAMPASLSKEFQAVLQQSLSKDRASRPVSAEDMQQRVSALSNRVDENVQSQADSIFLAADSNSEPFEAFPAASRADSRFLILGLAAFIFVAGVLASFIYITKSDDTASSEDQLKTQDTSVATTAAVADQTTVAPAAPETSSNATLSEEITIASSSTTTLSQIQPTATEKTTVVEPIPTQTQPTPTSLDAASTTTQAPPPRPPRLSAKQQEIIEQLASSSIVGAGVVQEPTQIIFSPGDNQETVSGDLTINQRGLYTFAAQKNQWIELTLPDDPDVFFTVINPSGAILTSNGASAYQVTEFNGVLPLSGDYAILVTPLQGAVSFNALLKLV